MLAAVNATGYVTFAELAPDPKDYPDALPHGADLARLKARRCSSLPLWRWKRVSR